MQGSGKNKAGWGISPPTGTGDNNLCATVDAHAYRTNTHSYFKSRSVIDARRILSCAAVFGRAQGFQVVATVPPGRGVLGGIAVRLTRANEQGNEHELTPRDIGEFIEVIDRLESVIASPKASPTTQISRLAKALPSCHT